jgi:hypothetical protein
MELPKILCGPILRRCDEQLTPVWLATSYELPAKAALRIEDASGRKAVEIPTRTETRSVRVGEKLYVNLLLARGMGQTPPRDDRRGEHAAIGPRAATCNVAFG